MYIPQQSGEGESPLYLPQVLLRNTTNVYLMNHTGSFNMKNISYTYVNNS